MFVQTLMIVMVNFDTTFPPAPFLSSPPIDSRRPVVSNPKRGLYLSEQGENRVAFKMTQQVGEEKAASKLTYLGRVGRGRGPGRLFRSRLREREREEQIGKQTCRLRRWVL